MSEYTPNRRLTKRTVLKAIGAGTVAGSLGGTTSARSQSQSNRPTVTVDSTDCEELTVSYSSGNGPRVTVSVTGPSGFTAELAPGDSITESVDPGLYAATAAPTRPEQAQARGRGSGVAVDGSSSTVTSCDAGQVRIEPYCYASSDESYNYYRATNTTDRTVILGARLYSGDEVVVEFTGAGMSLSAGESGSGSLEADWFERTYGKPLTKLEFEAIYALSREEVPVSLSEVNYPEDLPCGDGGSGSDPTPIGQVDVRAVCTTLSDVDGYFYKFYQKNNTDAPVVIQMDVYSGETLLMRDRSSLLHPDLEMSLGTYHETYFRDANVTRIEVSAETETGESVTVSPSEWDIPDDLPSC